MLRTRIITAVVLLAVLGAVLYSGSQLAIIGLCTVFLGAAMWEGQRLAHSKFAVVSAIVWTAAFIYLTQVDLGARAQVLFGLASAIWLIRLAPSLAIGLPVVGSFASKVLTSLYCITILACFLAILVLVAHSSMYLISTMAIVWLADIGAYFSGKAFGKRKLAPTISPGKSWEGVVGGWLCVQAAAAACVFVPALHDTFPAHLYLAFGALGAILILSVMVAASVAGDLFESMLKRRVEFKDSSQLLPGHGGVLDRIDALIPVLPMAVLVAFWF